MKKFSILFCMIAASAVSTPVVADEINSLPESAEVKSYSRSCSLFTTFWGATFPQEESMLPGKIAFDGTDVYMLDPVDGYQAYIKGVIEGNVITFEFPQQISNSTYLNRLTNVSDEDGKWSYALNDEAPNTLTFHVEADGTVKMDSKNDDVIMGVTNASGVWQNRGAFGLEFEPFDMSTVELPADVETATYVLTRDGNSRNITAGFSGNDFYVQGLCELLPEAWAKGTLNDDKVTFPSGKYMGIDPRLGYLLSMYGVTPGTRSFEPAFIMSYDSQNGSLKAVNDLLLCPGEDFVDMLSFEVESNIVLVPAKEITDYTPAAPQITDVVVYPQYPNQGWDYMDVNLSIVTVDGQLLNTDNIYYRLLLDNEPYILMPDDFEDLEEPMEWIPYDFECYDLENLGGTSRSVSIYISDVTKYSVQEKYVDGDKEYLSAISTWGETVGVKGVESVDATEKDSFFTDLSGRRVKNPISGIYVKTTIYSDGNVVNRKIIVK